MSGHSNKLAVVGRSLPGVDSVAKLTGTARFTGDRLLPGMLHGKILRSPHAHARVRSVDTRRALAIPGVVSVLTGADLAGLDPFYGMYIRDQPVLAIDKVRYVGDPIAVVGAVDEATAYQALASLDVEYDVLPSVMTMDAALSPDAPSLFESRHAAALAAPGPGVSWVQEPAPNVLYVHTVSTGDLEASFGICAHVFEDRFSFARISHYCLEPHIVLAQATDTGAEVWSNNQDPFLLRQDIARIFKLPLDAVRFHAGFIGGGFGAKSYCKIEPIAVLLARKSGRPVRLALTMDESMLTVCEHGAEITLRTGLDARGQTVAREARVRLDGGAYADSTPSVAARLASRLGGGYRWQAFKAEITAIRTNTVPAGSFRGFGAVHATWASESQIDMIARRLKDDPLELRLRNFVALGSTCLPTESALDTDLDAGLRAVADRIGYSSRRRKPGCGIGFAVGLKSAGTNHRADASVRILPSGEVLVASGVSEIGQSTRTVMTQVVAEVLGVAPDIVSVVDIDTAETPYDAGTHASTGATVSGLAARRAAENARDSVLAFAVRALACRPDELTYESLAVRHRGRLYAVAKLLALGKAAAHAEFSGKASVQTPPSKAFFWMPSWTAAEVEVDRETGHVHVLRLVNAVEVGTALNPERCRSQTEGGAVQGLGQALFEQLAYDGDMPLNAQPLKYRVPRLSDVPLRFETLVLEQGHGPGPFGAKGVGESGNMCIPAAIANAIADATGARVTDLPLTPDRVLDAINRR